MDNQRQRDEEPNHADARYRIEADAAAVPTTGRLCFSSRSPRGCRFSQPEVGVEAKASTDLLDELMEPAATVAKLVGPQPVVSVPAGDFT